MKREIIFRGKREITGEWVEGYLVKRDEPFLHDIVVPVGNTSSITYAIIRGSVGQYTGLKDKNQKRIFEGDIVKFKLQDADEYRFAKILYGEFVDENDSQFYLGFYVVGMGCTFSIFNGKDEGYDFIGICEVAGNIHDSPELLVTE